MRRVLVVDDDEHIRSALFEAFRMKGYKPLLAEDGLRAQVVVNRHRPAAILLDLMMPNMDGWQFLDWLRESGRLPKTRVIIITAHNQPDEADLIRRGAALVLRKPMDLSVLFSAVEEAFAAVV